jgi:hypothetical protein
MHGRLGTLIVSNQSLMPDAMLGFIASTGSNQIGRSESISIGSAAVHAKQGKTRQRTFGFLILLCEHFD